MPSLRSSFQMRPLIPSPTLPSLRRVRPVAAALVMLLVAACGSPPAVSADADAGSTAGSDAGATPADAGTADAGATPADAGTAVADAGATTYVISGAVSGLLGSGLVLQNNAGDDLAVQRDGAFTFDTRLAGGTSYAVTVKTQPSSPRQTCVVIGGRGTVGVADVTTVIVACQSDTLTIGGTVSGLAGLGLTLRNNGGPPLAIAGNGAFVFQTGLTDGSPYSVTVDTQPTGPRQTCSVASGAGTLAGSNVTDVAVACVTDRFTVGGSVSGLVGSGLTLRNNGSDDLVITANGSYAFATSLADLSGYAVVVHAQPSGNQTCLVMNASGALSGADVTNADISCACTPGWHLEGSACAPDTRSCPVANGTGSQTWSSGAWSACALVGCNTSYADCDGNAANGCEANTSTSASHCGSCNAVCAAGKSCYSGLCSVTCSGNTGYTSPVMGCTNLSTRASMFSASSAYPGAAPSNVGDANSCTAWNSGNYAPATWQIDLGTVRSIAALSMVPSMQPNGAVQHVIEGSVDGSTWTQVLSIAQLMSSMTLYSFTLPSRVSARHLRVRTLSSPSWVSWVDVNVWGDCP